MTFYQWAAIWVIDASRRVPVSQYQLAQVVEPKSDETYMKMVVCFSKLRNTWN